MSVVDVGAGDGEFLRLALSELHNLLPVTVTLVEPSGRLVQRLHKQAKKYPSPVSVSVRQSTAEKYSPGQKVDVILASHLPFPKRQLPQLYGRLLGWLKPGGHLIIVLRGRDDVHAFRTRFKSLLSGIPAPSLTVDDARAVLTKISVGAPLRISSDQARATLSIPWPEDPVRTKVIVEFLLNHQWKDFPEDMKRKVLRSIIKKQGTLSICDGFLIVTTRKQKERTFP